MIKPSRGILIGAVITVVVAAVVFAFTIPAALTARKDAVRARPTLSASVGSTLVDVPPLQFCEDIARGRCDQRTAPARPVKLPVRPGGVIVISLPHYITSTPWDITVQRYDTATGKPVLDTQTHVQPTKATLVLKSTDRLLLAAVEIRVPSDAQDSFGNLLSQAVWGIDTLPKNAVPAAS